MIFEGEVGRDSGVLVGDDVIGVLDPNSENLLLPLVKMSCFFQLKSEQNQTSVEITLQHYTLGEEQARKLQDAQAQKLTS